VDFERADALNTAIRTIGIRHRALAGALLAPLGLHPGQEVLLLELDAQGPRSQGQLAASSGCEPPTITVSVRKLEAAGLVVRRASTSDARVTIVELSDRGKALMPGLKDAWRQLADVTVAQLTSIPVERLADVMSDVAASLTSSDARPGHARPEILPPRGS